MKFTKVKKPAELQIGPKPGAMVCKVGPDGEAHLNIGNSRYIGPRAAISLARWLIRYARWSSLK